MELGGLTIEGAGHEALDPSSFRHRILASTRLRRWVPLQLRQMARPRWRVARRVSVRAWAPGVVSFQGRPLRRVGMTAEASRAAMAA